MSVGSSERGESALAATRPLRTPTIVLTPASGFPGLGLWELLGQRDLVYLFARRDLRVRYNQTTIGVLWAVLQPLLQALVFTLVFGRAVRVPSEGVPYELFVFAALLPWQMFSSSSTRGAASIVSSQSLITRVFFPRLALPVSSVLVAMFDLALTLALFLAFLAFLGRWPGSSLIFLPFVMVAAVLASLGTAAGLAALNVRYRDVTHAVPFLIQLWTFATPVVYPIAIIPEHWRTLYALNPMVVVVEGFRITLLGIPGPGTQVLLISATTLVATFFIGVTYFRLLERSLADEV